MKLVRSWPVIVPGGRSYVVDQLDRVIIRDYDMSALAEVGDDVLLIEWDLAVGAEELTAFAEAAAAAPERVRAAPYRLYTRHTADHPSRNPPIEPQWSAWTYAGGDQRHGGLVEASPGDPHAHISGLGLIYLPRPLILAYIDARDAAATRGDMWRFSDISFFGWHYRCVRHEVDLDWAARPVHLHYTSDRIRIPGGTHVRG